MPFYDIVLFIYSEKDATFCKISTLGLSHVVPIKSKVEISQNFVAFLEYMNFSNVAVIICPSWLTEFTNSGKHLQNFIVMHFRHFFFCKDEIPYCLFTLTFLREIPTEPLQFPSRTKEFKTSFWLLKNSVVTVTLVMEG